VREQIPGLVGRAPALQIGGSADYTNRNGSVRRTCTMSRPRNSSRRTPASKPPHNRCRDGGIVMESSRLALLISVAAHRVERPGGAPERNLL